MIMHRMSIVARMKMMEKMRKMEAGQLNMMLTMERLKWMGCFKISSKKSGKQLNSSASLLLRMIFCNQELKSGF